MNVKELMEKLRKLNPEMPVYTYDPEYGKFHELSVIEVISDNTSWAYDKRDELEKDFLLI